MKRKRVEEEEIEEEIEEDMRKENENTRSLIPVVNLYTKTSTKLFASATKTLV